MYLDTKREGEARTNAFLPASTLGITEQERDALIRTLALLDGGTIKDGKGALYLGLAEPEVFPTLFDMSLTSFATDCGTSCCILGFARYISNDFNIFEGSTRKEHPASSLLFPLDGIGCTDPKKGAKALRNYLESGNPKWPEVMTL